MPEENRYSNHKIIGIGTTLLFIFFLTLICTLITGCSTSGPTYETSVTESAPLITDNADSFAEPVSAEEEVEELPQYTGEPFVILHGDVPLFTEEDKQSITGVSYSNLDELGRCGPAYGRIGPETIPSVQRGTIGDVKPSGWHTVRYDNLIEDRYLYNRCHLIAYQLAGANAEERNLITGTRYLNINGMLPIENKVLDYINGTGNHVLYRVTPVFEGDNLVASGVVMEAWSVEDKGKSIQLCRYLFNVQPGVVIDYSTGDSYEENIYLLDPSELEFEIIQNESGTRAISRQMSVTESTDDITYVLNINTMRFHKPTCPSVEDMKEKNREYSYSTREELIEQGYKPCGSCNP